MARARRSALFKPLSATLSVRQHARNLPATESDNEARAAATIDQSAAAAAMHLHHGKGERALAVFLCSVGHALHVNCRRCVLPDRERGDEGERGLITRCS